MGKGVAAYLEGRRIGSIRGMMQRGWVRIDNGFILAKKFYTSNHFYYITITTRRNEIIAASALLDGIYHVYGVPTAVVKAIEVDIEYSFRRGRDDERATIAQVGMVEG